MAIGVLQCGDEEDAGVQILGHQFSITDADVRSRHVFEVSVFAFCCRSVPTSSTRTSQPACDRR